MRMVVVFPAPFGPRRPNTEPWRMLRSTPLRARVSPNDLARPLVSIALAIRSPYGKRSGRGRSRSAGAHGRFRQAALYRTATLRRNSSAKLKTTTMEPRTGRHRDRDHALRLPPSGLHAGVMPPAVELRMQDLHGDPAILHRLVHGRSSTITHTSLSRSSAL
jgi:hypothetical protein